MKLCPLVLAIPMLTIGLLPCGCRAVAPGSAEPATDDSTSARAANPLKIDFHWRYNQAQAERLFNGAKYVEAEKAFRTLADTAPSPLQKARCLAQAAMAMGYQEGKGQYDAAMTLAETIDDAAWNAYAQMVILSAHDKFDELIARFKDADIAAWPEEIAYTGFNLRGRAYAESEDLAAAVADYEAAWERVPPRERLWPNLVNTIAACYQKLDQDEKALQTYRKAFAVYDGDVHWKGGSYHGNTMLAAAALLQRQGKDQEALDVLMRYEIPSKSVRFRILAAAGDLYAKLGRKQEAIAAYREAIADNEKYKQYEDYNETLRKKIEELQ